MLRGLLRPDVPNPNRSWLSKEWSKVLVVMACCHGAIGERREQFLFVIDRLITRCMIYLVVNGDVTFLSPKKNKKFSKNYDVPYHLPSPVTAACTILTYDIVWRAVPAIVCTAQIAFQKETRGSMLYFVSPFHWCTLTWAPEPAARTPPRHLIPSKPTSPFV